MISPLTEAQQSVASKVDRFTEARLAIPEILNGKEAKETITRIDLIKSIIDMNGYSESTWLREINKIIKSEMSLNFGTTEVPKYRTMKQITTKGRVAYEFLDSK